MKLAPSTQTVQFVDDNTWFRGLKTAKRGDVGHDLHVNVSGCKLTQMDRLVSWFVGTKVVVIWPFQAKLVASGIKLSMPDDLWCMVTARSSAMKKKLKVVGGIIDSGYQGELFAVLHNFGLRPRIIKNSERYAQVIFFPAVRPYLEEKYLFFDRDTERGETGFGSSGR